MLVVHLGTTVTAEFGLADDHGNIIQRKSASVQLASTVDPAPWATLREQVAALRDQIQAQTQPVPAIPAAALDAIAAPAAEEQS